MGTFVTNSASPSSDLPLWIFWGMIGGICITTLVLLGILILANQDKKSLSD